MKVEYEKSEKFWSEQFQKLDLAERLQNFSGSFDVAAFEITGITFKTYSKWLTTLQMGQFPKYIHSLWHGAISRGCYDNFSGDLSGARVRILLRVNWRWLISLLTTVCQKKLIVHKLTISCFTSCNFMSQNYLPRDNPRDRHQHLGGELVESVHFGLRGFHPQFWEGAHAFGLVRE